MCEIFKVLDDKIKEGTEYIELTKDEYIDCCRAAIDDTEDDIVGHYKEIPIRIKDEPKDVKEIITDLLVKTMTEELQEIKITNKILLSESCKLKEENKELKESLRHTLNYVYEHYVYSADKNKGKKNFYVHWNKELEISRGLIKE